jgi:hypothetical protein
MQQMLQSTNPPWLVLLYQVPAKPSSLRVRVWRRLQAAGAVPLRNAAYVLPNRPEPREDLAWIAADLRALGGQATVLASAALDGAEDEELRAAFRAARAGDYRALTKDAHKLWASAERLRGRTPGELGRAERRLRLEWERLSKVTFFDTPAQKEASDMLSRLRSRLQPARTQPERPGAAEAESGAFRGRTWVTRPRPGIDRMASAWLIRSYVDKKARFAFAERPPGKAVPFDMYEGEFSHTGEACTFEVLARRFAIEDEPVAWLGRVVHDVDLREDRYGEPETAGVALMVEGLRSRHADDHALLEAGIALFASLARGREARPAAKAASPRPRPGRAATPRRSRRRPA